MYYFSNEIVFRGHPDKVCDQISAAILNECLKQDKGSRCGIEVAGGKGVVFITGEITSNADFNVEQIARRVLREVGYDDSSQIIDNIGKQSGDIALGTNSLVKGAGDNGMMFGYAVRETEQYLPLAQIILQRLAQQYDVLRQNDSRFLADGKAQITGCYEEGHLKKIKTFTICYQNSETEREETDRIICDTARKIADEYEIEIEQFLINPTGRFLIGGFEGDAGLTGRKIVVDSYQSFGKVGGGCMNGKDPSKVDISGAYMARKFACEVLDSHPEVYWCEVQISYAIGKKEPLAIYIRTDRGSIEADESMYYRGQPANIIEELDMLNIDYEEKARFGHFTGR